MVLNINSSTAVTFTNTLEKMHKSALPVAIRSTLNSAAFDVKKNTMPKEAEDAFENRSKNFFKANSRVEMAKGFDIKSMESVVGFTENGLKGGNNYAVKDLEQQEYGGTIKKKSFIAMDQARGGSPANLVRAKNRLSAINNVVNSNTIAGKSAKQKFKHAVSKAGKGGYVLSNGENKTLFEVQDVEKMKLKPLYSFEENRSVNVDGTGFMRSASIQSGNKMERFYAIEAEKQIKRLAK